MGWLLNLDRRAVFALMAFAVATPILAGWKFPEKATLATTRVFETIENLPPRSRILVSLDYDPAGMSELHPMSAAITRHAALKSHRLYYLSLWPTGPAFIGDMSRLLQTEFPDLAYGVDYVNLGYRSGEMGVIKVIGSDLRQEFSSDVRRQNLASIPMTSDLKNIREMQLIVSISGGVPGAIEWVQFASTPYGIPTVAGTTGVQTPELMPYVPKQLNGVLGGVKAAAEYERMLVDHYPILLESGRPAARPGLFTGTIRMGPQLVAHLLMIGLILLGNLSFFLSRRRPKQESSR